ncbi:IS21-like element helper ATPase IstB [Fimbriiglobus ruber]|uniref:IS21-like element helper ATPase IstB n=1 Tax=Fimbriiglobus ruber TaxID=1908690 RepID=UPI000B4AD8AB|nr:IS21-like element helper ATPase IstB [Fimbriiglobus ruber]
MTDPSTMLLKANLKTLKLPTVLAEYEKLAREAASRDESYDAYLLKLTELEVATRTANAVAARIRSAGFPMVKEFDTFDFTAMPSLPKQKALELARGEWVDQRTNVCLIGGSGTGKTHVAVAWGLSLCRLGKKVRFVTAASLVTELEEAQQQHRLDRMLSALDRLDLLIVDELGYLSFSRGGAELLFQVFADRYERRSLLITSNLPFSEWGSVFQGERMTAALLDRLTHRCEIFEMNGESYRFRESMKNKPTKTNTSKK